jgi:hypothetical protein
MLVKYPDNMGLGARRCGVFKVAICAVTWDPGIALELALPDRVLSCVLSYAVTAKQVPE